MSATTDVFIIGGGPAGLAAAIAARNRGFTVTLADGADPPIDKPCGEGLMPDSLVALRALGIKLREVDGHVLRGIHFRDRETFVAARFPGAPGMGVRRSVLHQKMLEQARNVGVSFLWKTPVAGLCSDGVIVAGKMIPARWIIGADGIASRVRRWAGLRTHRRRQSRYAFRRHYRLQPWSDSAEIYWSNGAQAYVTPVASDAVCVVLISRDPDFRSASLRTQFPELARHLQSGSALTTERGALTITQRLDHVYRDRIALIGDASGSVDAITGEGLCLSFLQAMALAEALQAGDLSRYQRAHRRLARRPVWMSKLMLLLDKHPALRRRAMHALSAHPDIFSRLLAVHVGATSPAHLVTTGALLAWRFVET